MFPTQERAEDYERKVLSKRSTNTIGHLFPLWVPILWPPEKSRDDCVAGRVKDVVAILGKDLQIRGLDDDKIEELKAKLAAKGNKTNTIANKLNAVSKLLRYAKKKKLIEAMPDFQVERDQNAYRTYVLGPNQEDALITALPERWQRFAIFLIDTASRGFSECRHLEWHHIDFAGRSVSFWYNKTDKPRTVPLTPDAIAVLRELQKEGWAKPWAILGTPGYSYRIWNQFWNIAREKAGLPKGEVVAYTLRHTMATRLAKKGMDILKLADQLGHSNLSTTRRYVHTDVEDQRKFVDQVARKRAYRKKPTSL
jgi:integrase